MAVKFNPFTGKIEILDASTFKISEDGKLPNGNSIAEIQDGVLQNVSEIDAGEFQSTN